MYEPTKQDCLRHTAIGCSVAIVLLLLLTLVLFHGCPLENGAYIPSNSRPDPSDDVLAAKSPEYLPELASAIQFSRGPQCFLNASAAVIRLDVAGMKDIDAGFKDEIYPSFKEAWNAANTHEKLPSIDMLDAWSKQADDRIIRILEKSLHDSGVIFPGGKQGYLREMLAVLQSSPAAEGKDEAVAFITAALKLGGDPQQPAGKAVKLVEAEINWFEDKPLASKPVGVYDEDEILRQVFKRDRMLQQPFIHNGNLGGVHNSLLPVIRIAEALVTRPDLLDAYIKYELLAASLTNPSANFSITDVLDHRQLFYDPGKLWQALLESGKFADIRRMGNTNPENLGVAFWPFSSANENSLFNELYGNNPELPGESVMDALADAIQAGKVGLAPDETSGWYDYQQYSLETLLLPELAQESDKLLLTGKYKLRLRKAFEAMATQRRESHIKEIGIFKTKGGPIIPPKPVLSLEPAATFYLQTARAYGMLADSLGENLADDTDEIIMDDGTQIVDYINMAMGRFFGLYLTVCNDITMQPSLTAEDWRRIRSASAETEAAEREYYWLLPGYDIQLPDQRRVFNLWTLTDWDQSQRQTAFALWLEATEWLNKELANSPEAAADVRVIVPVLQNALGDRARYWTVLGVQYRRLIATYEVPPRTVEFSKLRETLKEDEQGNLILINDEARRWLETNSDASVQDWQPASYLIPVYVFAEMTLGAEPPTRGEFRAVCDQGGSPEQIAARLGQRFGPSGKLGATLRQLDWRLLAAAVAVLALLVLLTARGVRTRRTAE